MKSILVTTREEKQKALQKIKELGFDDTHFSYILNSYQPLYISYTKANWWVADVRDIKTPEALEELNAVGWKEFLDDSTPRFGGEEKFSVEEIRKYLDCQDDFREVYDNLNAENIRKVNDR